MIFIKSSVAILLSISAAAVMYFYWPDSDSAIVSETSPPTTPATPMIPMAPMPQPTKPPEPPMPEPTLSNDSDSLPIAPAALGTIGLVLLASIFEQGKGANKDSI